MTAAILVLSAIPLAVALAVVFAWATASIREWRGYCPGSWGWDFECELRRGHEGPCDGRRP